MVSICNIFIILCQIKKKQNKNKNKQIKYSDTASIMICFLVIATELFVKPLITTKILNFISIIVFTPCVFIRCYVMDDMTVGDSITFTLISQILFIFVIFCAYINNKQRMQQTHQILVSKVNLYIERKEQNIIMNSLMPPTVAEEVFVKGYIHFVCVCVCVCVCVLCVNKHARRFFNNRI